MAISYTIAKHATASPSNVLAQVGGKHIYNVKLTSDVDNGNFIARGTYLSLDLYQQAAVTSFEGVVRQKMANGNYLVEVVTPGDALFVYSVPTIAEDYTNEFKKESNFYNKSGSVARCYELAVGDKVEISAEGFTGTFAVGDAVEVATMKLQKKA